MPAWYNQAQTDIITKGGAALTDAPALGDTVAKNAITQLNDPNIKGKYIGFIPNSPLLNIRDENGKDSVFSLAKIVGEDGVKRIQGDWVERQKMDVQQQGLKLQERGLGIQQQNANISQDYLNLEKNKVIPQPGENLYGGIPIATLGGNGLTSFMNTINSEMNLAKEVPTLFKQIKEAQKIIKETPELGETLINALGKTDITKTLMDDNVRSSFEKVDKISNRVVESFIRARGNITDEERKTIKQGIFNVFLSGNANEYNSKSIIEELEKAYLRGNFDADQISKGFIASPQGFEQYLKDNPQAIENVRKEFNLNDSEMVTVINPNGISGKMPKANLQKALESGYKVIQ
jgi:hypothetical protein